jgi:hypothetical protein
MTEAQAEAIIELLNQLTIEATHTNSWFNQLLIEAQNTNSWLMELARSKQ